MLEIALPRVRAHGREWSVREEHGALNKVVKSADDLTSGDPALRGRALAFLVASLGNERFAGLNASIRQWLLDKGPA